MATNTRHHKRKFQPSITSYFSIADRYDGGVHSATVLQTSSTPPLPTEIQSSLLNVGMRVRKSIPEGYKRSPKYTTVSSSNFERPTSVPLCSERRAFAELTPYCGIMKVGGHLIQPAPAEGDVPSLQFDDENDGFLSSQESNTSTISTDSMPSYISHFSESSMNKRRREDPEDGYFPDPAIPDDQLDFQPVSPRSYPISHTRMPNLDSLRPIAMPKTRRKQHATVLHTRQIPSYEMGDVDDFEEAEFFRPDDWEKGEVEMGGL